jgi:hypothetical protein
MSQFAVPSVQQMLQRAPAVVCSSLRLALPKTDPPTSLHMLSTATTGSRPHQHQLQAHNSSDG